MKKLLLITLLITANFISFAGDDKKLTTSINGQIVDSNTKEPLAGVAIKIENTDQTVYTDFDGNYSIDNITPGEHKLTISYVSYEEVKNLKIDTNKKSYNLSLTAE